MDFHFCPHCGRPSIIPFYSYPFPAPQPEYRDDPTLVHFILFAISFIVPLLGFLLGFLLTRTEHSPEDRHAGRICILLAFVWPLIIILFLIRIMGII
jgi:4-amino-4-deoxy-L-arabinose transferase-like glycosyltransferase